MFWMYSIAFIILIVIGFVFYFSYTRKKALKHFEALDTFSQQALIAKMRSVGVSTTEFELIVSKKAPESPDQLFERAVFLFYTGQNPEEALASFTLLAEQNDADAFYFLGEIYRYKDELKAQAHYLQATEKGSACGQYAWAKQILDDQLMVGLTVEQMETIKKKALDAMYKAAEQKHSEACFWLAMQYVQGSYGLAINYQKARDLFEVIAQKETTLGVPLKPSDLKKSMGYFEPQIAQCALGLYYVSALPASIDYKKAESYFKKAVASEHPESLAYYALAKLYDENNLNLDEAHAKALSIKFYQKACHSLLTNIDHRAAISYYYNPSVGREKAAAKVEQNKYDESSSPESSFETIEALAKLGKIKSQFILARMYLQADKVQADEAKALYWFEKAALQGHAEAQYRLACLLNDKPLALTWFKQAADQFIINYITCSVFKDYGFDCLMQGFLPQTIVKEDVLEEIAVVTPLQSVSMTADSYIEQYIALKNYIPENEDDFQKNKVKITECLTKLSHEMHPEVCFYQAVEHYSELNYDEALIALNSAHQQGSKHCFYLLGHLHDYGEGVETDYNKARQYYAHGAKLGCCYAQFAEWVSGKAIGYLESAAKQNHLGAMNQLAENYLEGKNGYPLDYEKAYYGYSSLVNAKRTTLSLLDYMDKFSGFNGLANIYVKGLGRPQDFQAAADYFEKSEFSEALYAAANIYYGNFLAIPATMALEKATRLYERLCDSLLVHKDLDLEIDLYDEETDDEDDSSHQVMLSYYDEGTNPESSLQELLALAEQGFSKSQYIVGLRYADPEQEVYDQDKAAYWFTQAAQANHDKAIYELGKHYLHVKKQIDKAAELLRPLVDRLIEAYVSKYEYTKPKPLLTVEELKRIQNI